jgi:hypothetical protein
MDVFYPNPGGMADSCPGCQSGGKIGQHYFKFHGNDRFSANIETYSVVPNGTINCFEPS